MPPIGSHNLVIKKEGHYRRHEPPMGSDETHQHMTEIEEKEGKQKPTSLSFSLILALAPSSSGPFFFLLEATRRTLTSVWGRSWPKWSDLVVWPTLILSPLLLFLFSCSNQNLPSHHLHPFVLFGSVYRIIQMYIELSNLYIIIFPSSIQMSIQNYLVFIIQRILINLTNKISYLRTRNHDSNSFIFILFSLFCSCFNFFF